VVGNLCRGCLVRKYGRKWYQQVAQAGNGRRKGTASNVARRGMVRLWDRFMGGG
jgi:hypothetical protein